MAALLIVDRPRRIGSAFTKPVRAAEQGQRVSIPMNGLELRGLVDSRLRRGSVEDYGITLTDPPGRMVLSMRRGGVGRGEIFFNGDPRAFLLTRKPGRDSWSIVQTSVDRLICARPGESLAGASEKDPDPPRAPDGPQAAPGEPATPVLESLPGATHVIYCDFDGEVLTHPFWNGGSTVYAQPYLHYEYTRSKSAVAMGYGFSVPQGGDPSLSGGPSVLIQEIDLGDTETLTHRHSVPVGSAPKGFLGLRVGPP